VPGWKHPFFLSAKERRNVRGIIRGIPLSSNLASGKESKNYAILHGFIINAQMGGKA
jgi:hypothetical protein